MFQDLDYQPTKRYHSRGMLHKGEMRNSLHGGLTDLCHPGFDHFLSGAAIRIFKSHQHLECYIIYGVLCIIKHLNKIIISMTIPPIIGVKQPLIIVPHFP